MIFYQFLQNWKNSGKLAMSQEFAALVVTILATILIVAMVEAAKAAAGVQSSRERIKALHATDLREHTAAHLGIRTHDSFEAWRIRESLRVREHRLTQVSRLTVRWPLCGA
ncbi:hypothetical protein [Streptomyces sp. SAJ15]|uniref:hypothetical protein n=1 Tax=Streptomyces sp. SAJ15 TaxID=2011095 RepID=UPI00118473DE|nr:hypothetical protein [Streptomyces sp. SAJ15]TVL90254.1 hypothetical protein CD790_22310 [Streptomyces sp. SAJ15]